MRRRGGARDFPEIGVARDKAFKACPERSRSSGKERELRKMDRLFFVRARARTIAGLGVFAALLAACPFQISAQAIETEVPASSSAARALARSIFNGIRPEQEEGAKARMMGLIARSKDGRARIVLVRDLSRLSPGVLAASDLDPVLSDQDPRVRMEGVRIEAFIGGGQAVSRLSKMLSGDPSTGVRMAAAFWLGGLKGAGGVSGLAGALSGDKNPNVRVRAAWALRRIGTPSARTALGQARDDPDPRVRRIAGGR